MTLTRAVLPALVVLASLTAACVLAMQPMLDHAAAPGWTEGRSADGGALAVRGGLALLELSGMPDRRGRQAAALVGRQAGDLLAVMRFNPRPAIAARGTRLPADLAAMREADRAEIAAFAAASGMPERDLVLANATIETMCSAVVHQPSAKVARNMDFFPPGPLGQATVVQIVREPGRHTYASVGWPAMFGVISGMNDTGLTACILLNWRGEEPPPGEPLPLRVRAILQDCADVESGLAALGAAPVGSRHYVLLADAHRTAIGWWTPTGMQVDRPAADGWLVASNWIRENGAPRPDDLRGSCLLRLCAAQTTTPDDRWFRRILSASYMPMLNAQAMVFDPRRRHLELALADGWIPAAKRGWFVCDLGPALDGADVATVEVTRLLPERPLRHYLLGE
jgi:hypothetical protein